VRATYLIAQLVQELALVLQPVQEQVSVLEPQPVQVQELRLARELAQVQVPQLVQELEREQLLVLASEQVPHPPHQQLQSRFQRQRSHLLQHEFLLILQQLVKVLRYQLCR